MFRFSSEPLIFMSALSNHLERLLGWLESIGRTPPSRDVRIIEITEFDPRSGKYHARKGELREPSEYESRFDELLRTGYDWLNMSCYGVYDGFLIVAIEVPSATVPEWTASGWSQQARALYPGCFTSVNLSGPQPGSGDDRWCVKSVLAIE
jgi:hypothetical protein